MTDKVLSMLSMAQKAGKLISGESMVLDSIRSGSAYLVIIAQDASDNSKKLFTDKTSFYNIRLLEYGDKVSLGTAIGKAERSSIAIEDEGFARAIEKYFK